jgi:hypothetical protein
METTEVTMTVVNMSLPLWGYYILAAILGALASSLVINKGNFILPHMKYVPDDVVNPKRQKRLYERAKDMGFTGDIIVGVAAAAAVLWSMTPQTFFQLIGIGAVAGYGGSTILQSLVNKVAADISETEKKTIALEKDQQDVAETQAKLNSVSGEKFIVEKLLEYKPK